MGAESLKTKTRSRNEATIDFKQLSDHPARRENATNVLSGYVKYYHVSGKTLNSSLWPYSPSLPARSFVT